jgi:hypothetical protein
LQAKIFRAKYKDFETCLVMGKMPSGQTARRRRQEKQRLKKLRLQRHDLSSKIQRIRSQNDEVAKLQEERQLLIVAPEGATLNN